MVQRHTTCLQGSLSCGLYIWLAVDCCKLLGTELTSHLPNRSKGRVLHNSIVSEMFTRFWQNTFFSRHITRRGLGQPEYTHALHVWLSSAYQCQVQPTVSQVRTPRHQVMRSAVRSRAALAKTLMSGHVSPRSISGRF